MRELIVLLGLAVGTACTPRATWVPAEPKFMAPAAGFSVELPAGWTRFEDPRHPDDLVLTRDGTSVGRIVALSDEPGHAFVWGDSKRVITARMSPEDAAEAAIDALEASNRWSEFKVSDSAPVTLAGRKGFRFLASYRNPDGLRMGIAVYGVIIPSGAYYLILQAPERVYFARHLSAVDSMAASFQLRPDAKGMKRKRDDGEKAKPPGPPAAPERTPSPAAPAPSA